MAEVHQDFQTVLDDGMRLAAFDMTYKADPASVVLKTRIIQSQAGLVII
jgi:azurin